MSLWLHIELVWLDVLAEAGVIPSEVPALVRRRELKVDPERARELEATLRHDVIAFLTSLAEQLGPESRYLHYGLTSSDILDTAFALQILEAGALVSEALDALRRRVALQADRYRQTPQMGRTHGVHAEPLTFGVKLAGWYAELDRAASRLRWALDRVRFGKLAGAVGIHGTTRPEWEEAALERLGLQVEPLATQIVPRDRHADVLYALAALGAALERMATEIRNLARPEIREVQEPFRRGQKGSSAMPHKRNPIVCERLSGMARLLRTNALAGLENIATWHERDISHSSVERVIFPDSMHLAYYACRRFEIVVRDLVVFEDRMRSNLEVSRGVVFSQRVMLRLVDAGLTREAAYAVVQRAAARCWDEGLTFRQALEEDEEVGRLMSRDELDACLDLDRQLRFAGHLIRRAGVDACVESAR